MAELGPLDIVAATDISRSGQGVLAERLASAAALVGFEPNLTTRWSHHRRTLFVGLPTRTDAANRQLARVAADVTASPAAVVWERAGYETADVCAGIDLPRNGRPLRVVTLNDCFVPTLTTQLERATIHVVHPPIPDGAFRLRRTARARSAVFVGRLTARKGALWLARAWTEHVYARTGTPLIMCGSGYDGPDSEEEAIAGLAARFPERLSQRLFWGFRERQAVLSEAMVAVFPYRSDHLPQALLECLAAGVPAVASDIPEFRTVLGDDVRGSLYSPGCAHSLADVVARVITNPRQTRAMAERARRFVQRDCSPNRVGRALCEVLAS